MRQLSRCLLLVSLAAGCGSADASPDPTGTASTEGAGGDAGAGGGGTGAHGGTGGDAGQGGGGSGGEGAGVPGAWCTPIPTCSALSPDPGPKGKWKHTGSSFVVGAGSPNHRGRDLYLNPGDDQWVLAKFSYGTIDKDLKDEEVDVYLLRDCGKTWEKLGSGFTTDDGEHPTVEGVEDTGGRLYFPIPKEKELGPGRHRVHLVVRGDLSTVNLFLEVVPKETPVVVTDVDGTLTLTENEEFGALLSGELPGIHPDAAKVFQILAGKGYHPMYLTGRPEWLMRRTRELLDANAFPPGIVHTTLSKTGATGTAAATYKTGELFMLAQKGIVPTMGFGNKATDATAYDLGSILPASLRFFFKFDDTEYGGRRIESYTELLAEMQALPSLCP